MSQDEEKMDDLRRRLRQELLSDGDLPEFLMSENVEVTPEVAERAARLRDAVLRGDIQEVRRISPGEREGAVLHRDEDEQDTEIPELEDAERRIRDRVESGGEDGVESDHDREDDPE